MARYVQRGRSRGTGQGRYEQLRGSGNGGLMAATMILGGALVVCIMLTVWAWVSRAQAISDYNELLAKHDAARLGTEVKKRRKHHEEVRMNSVVAPGCDRCLQLKRELDGTKQELRNAYGKMTTKQKDDLYYTYDIVAKKVTLDRVADPANPRLSLIQISFTVKNQSTETRGNILGLFRLYKGEEMVWQKKFEIDTLAAGATVHRQFTAPGRVKYDEWGCQLYPYVPSKKTRVPRR